MTVVSYIKRELSMPGRSFVKDWGELTDKDKADLKV